MQHQQQSYTCLKAPAYQQNTNPSEDFQTKIILQPWIWPQEQSSQIIPYGLQPHYNFHQQVPSFQISPVSKNFQNEDGIIMHEDQSQLNCKQLNGYQNHINKDKLDNLKMDGDLSGKRQSLYNQSILANNYINSYLMQSDVKLESSIKRQQLCQEDTTFLKNSNMPKFLIRIFLRNYRAILQNQDNLRGSNIIESIISFEKKHSNNPKSYYLLNHLISLLKLQSWPAQKNKIMRKIMNGIIKTKGKEQIIKSPQIKLKTSYLNALKVYSLRCFNSDLAQRLQSR